ncbi:nuclear pore complex protein Nup85-like isoform X1 [Leptotrombidium deliense]|uniref:Nuclear pore complex protein Nup85 n=1 Tax=Leptotrombidium deliense TaxID=299467 RepID=A0A443SR08_9ACAR|nr:nuclear pore complex protein Nup85-like isoform X1 [Leptotrombidium deliense]
MSRHLVSESSFVFKEVQRSNIVKDALSKKDVVKASRKYRSIIHATTSKLDVNNFLEEKLSYNQIEIIWHLCEILFIDLHQTGILLTQLLAWIRWHHPEVNQKTEVILNCSSPHAHEDYWDLVSSFILRGETENALNLLKLHPSANKGEFIVVCDLLQKMPVFSSNQALYEYDLRWQAWSSECRQHFEAFEDSEHLHHILGILAGDVPTFKHVLHLTDSWYHLMISLLLYTDPAIKEIDISVFSKQCVDIYLKHDPTKELTPFDNILIAAFNYDLMQVIIEASSSIKDNWWFVTHFVDLLYNGNLLDFYEIVDSHKLRESLILDYANSLMSHPSLWQIAIDYLEACPLLGRQHIELVLERIPFDDERKALKLVNAAEKRGLNDVGKSIYKVIARRWLSRDRLGSALIWAVRSEDPALINYLAELYLKQYVEKQQFIDEDVLVNLGPSMLTSDRLIFLGKYCEFYQLRKQRLLPEAGAVLVSLLSSKISPKFFIPTLLTDSIVLLEAERQVLNSDQSFQILEALDDFCVSVTTEAHSSQTDTEMMSDAFKGKEQILRLALSRNIARSSISLK